MNRKTLGSLTCLSVALVLLFVPAVKEPKVCDGPGTRSRTTFRGSLCRGTRRRCRCCGELYWLHDQPAGPLIPLWDEWMPMSTLWPGAARGRN